MNEKYFLQATEQLDNEAFVEEVYRTYLKRNSDAPGKSLFSINCKTANLHGRKSSPQFCSHRNLIG
jgi:hypothetical protein